MQMTERDWDMIQWLDLVRVADMDGVRWALGALAGAGETVSLRKAQQWSARLESVGLVGRFRPVYMDGSIVYPTRMATGQRPPNLLRQTTRHEVAVASVSARYMAAGYEWTRDRQPQGFMDHQADGVAIRDGVTEIVEVELTPKSWQRYKHIFACFSRRMGAGEIGRVSYFGAPGVDCVINRESKRWMMPAERAELTTTITFDSRARWVGENLPEHQDSYAE